MKANFKRDFRDFQAAVGTKLEHGSQRQHPPRNPGKWSKLIMRAQSGALAPSLSLSLSAYRDHNTCTSRLLPVLNMVHRALKLGTVTTSLIMERTEKSEKGPDEVAPGMQRTPRKRMVECSVGGRQRQGSVPHSICQDHRHAPASRVIRRAFQLIALATSSLRPWLKASGTSS
jgi:hypothetical protein